MPENETTLENIEITTEEILTGEELAAEPVPEADEVPAEFDAVPEAADEIAEDIEEAPEETDEDDGLVQVLTELRDSIDSLGERLASYEGRIAELEAREAARSKKLSGFFAPVKDGKDPDADPLPRIEKKYIY